MAVTLSTTQILDLVLDAFDAHVPMLAGAFATDLSDKEAKLNQQVTARIASVPTVQDYNASTGYKTNAAEAKNLMTDVPVTIDQHKHVPIKMDFLDSAASTIDTLLDEVTRNAGIALAKSVVDYCLGLVLSTNFSQSSTFTHANSDLDMLINVREDLNGVGASPIGRFGIVNSSVMSYLTADAEIASGDYHGQRIGGYAYGHLKNIQGFENIWEYPDMPTNSENLSSFFGTKEAIVLATRVPRDVEKLAQSMGIPIGAKFETRTDPETGLTLLGIQWVEQSTFDVYCTVTLMYGAVAGNQGGAGGALTDYAGHRVITS